MPPPLPVPAPTTVHFEHLLDSVTKPAQYLAGEHNARQKDWDAAQTRLALCFPDAYEIGMSNLAMGLLYELVNDDTPHLCDRCFTPAAGHGRHHAGARTSRCSAGNRAAPCATSTSSASP